MSTPELLAKVREQGIVLRTVEGRLFAEAPKGVVTTSFRGTLSANKAALIEHLHAEEAQITRRVTAMRTRLTPGRPLPFLHLGATHVPAACCLSCGDKLGEHGKIRCHYCREAAWRVAREPCPGVATP